MRIWTGQLAGQVRAESTKNVNGVVSADSRLCEFHLILVYGWMDWRYLSRDGKPAVEFSWEGIDEGNQCSGRGWAVLEGDGLAGRLFFHGGDDSGFTAERQKERKTAKRRRA